MFFTYMCFFVWFDARHFQMLQGLFGTICAMSFDSFISLQTSFPGFPIMVVCLIVYTRLCLFIKMAFACWIVNFDCCVLKILISIGIRWFRGINMCGTVICRCYWFNICGIVICWSSWFSYGLCCGIAMLRFLDSTIVKSWCLFCDASFMDLCKCIHVFESTHTCLVADMFVIVCFLSSGVCLLDCQIDMLRVDAFQFNSDLFIV